jgi:hypothetical protein
MELLGAAMLGWLIGTVALGVAWSTLSHHSLLRRMIFLACGFIAISSAWSLGLVAQFDTERVVLSEREEVSAIGIYPTFLLALAVPLLLMRKFFRLVFTPIEEPLVERQKMTTAWLMTVTAIIAICAAGFQFTVVRLELVVQTFARELGIGAGICMIISTVLILPSVLLLFSRKRNFALWSIVLIVVGCVVPFVVFQFWPFRLRSPSTEEYLITMVGFGCAMFALVCGAASVRSLGFRLGREVASSKIEKHSMKQV